MAARPKSFADYAKAARKKHQHSLEKAAAANGISKMTWLQWERGAVPKLNHIFRFGDYAGCSVDSLRGYFEKAS